MYAACRLGPSMDAWCSPTLSGYDFRETQPRSAAGMHEGAAVDMGHNLPYGRLIVILRLDGYFHLVQSFL
jgi:hypothetical protein